MRIVQVFARYDPPLYGGIQRTLDLLREAVPRASGHEVFTLCASDGPYTHIEAGPGGAVVHAASFGKLSGHPLSPSFPIWFKRLRPDVLHFHYPCLLSEISCLLAKPKCPIVVTYHCDVVRRGWHRHYEPALQVFLRRAHRILVTTKTVLETNPVLHPHLDRCTVQLIGIDTDRLRETERTCEVTRSLRQECAGPISLFVGRLRPYKGLHVLVDAMRHVPGTLVVVGAGAEAERLRKQVLAAGLSSRVRFAGEVPDSDLGGYYRAADLFVLPSISRAEFFGQAMAEAMACGLPAVSTRLGTGTSFLNRDEVTALEAPPGDVGALAAAMRRLLEDPAAARRMGEAARQHAGNFTCAKMVDSTIAIYEELAGRPTAAKPCPTI